MSAGARSRGLEGVIINGRCRDIAEHRRLGFPVSQFEFGKHIATHCCPWL
jgi:regulator of RNase E activity RraA